MTIDWLTDWLTDWLIDCLVGWLRLRAKMKQAETVVSETDAEAATVEPEVRSSSLSTFERLQEDIIQLEADKHIFHTETNDTFSRWKRRTWIELEADKRRLRRSVDQLRDEEKSLARRQHRRPPLNAGNSALTTVIQQIALHSNDISDPGSFLFRKIFRWTKTTSCEAESYSCICDMVTSLCLQCLLPPCWMLQAV